MSPTLLDSGSETLRTPLLWLSSGSLAGLREVNMLRACGYDAIYWQGPGDFSADAHTKLSADALAFLSYAPLNPMSPPVVSFLRKNFVHVVVEENPSMWGEIIRVFPGRTVFRSYGLASRLSDRLWECGVTQLMLQRHNLSFVPALPLAGVEESWVSNLAVQVSGAHVTSDDVDPVEWQGPFDTHRPVLAIVRPTLFPDHDRRHRGFVTEAFGGAPHITTIIDVPEPEGRLPWLATLPPEHLHDLSVSAGLLYTDQSSTFLHGYVLQAVAVGVPIIYFADSLIAKTLGDGPGQTRTVSEAQAKIRLLAAGDRGFIHAVLQAQQTSAYRLRADTVQQEFVDLFPRILESPSKIQNEKSLHILANDSDITNWLHTERLLTCLLDITPASAMEKKQRVVEYLFQVALQRDPGEDELRGVTDSAVHGVRPMQIMQQLLQSPEGQVVWSHNRMRHWLTNSSNPALF